MPQKVDSVLPGLFQIALPYMISRNAQGSGLSHCSSGFGGKKVQDLFSLDSCDYEHRQKFVINLEGYQNIPIFLAPLC